MRQDVSIHTSRFARVVDRLDHIAQRGSDDALIPLGFSGIDRMFGGGVRAGDLVIVAGDAGSGTSSLATGISLRAASALAERDRERAHTADEPIAAVPRVLMLTGELTLDRAHARAVAIASRIPSATLRYGDMDDISRARIAATAVELRDHGPHIERIEGGVTAIGAMLDRMRTVQLVVVDGLESLLESGPTTRTTRDDAIADCVLALKRIALEHEVALVVASHIVPPEHGRTDKRPRLTDLGARGAIGVHADVVLGLFREEIYLNDLGIAGAAEVILLKHREMQASYADLYFDAEGLRFEDVLEQ